MRGTTPLSMRSWAIPVEPGGSGPRRSKYPAGDSSPAFRAAGSSRGSARSRAGGSSVARVAVLLSLRREARQALLVWLNRSPALGAPREPVEPGDFALALDAGGVLGGQPADQRLDPVAQLEREVRRGRAHELADVLDGRLALEALGLLVLAHGPRGYPVR